MSKLGEILKANAARIEGEAEAARIAKEQAEARKQEELRYHVRSFVARVISHFTHEITTGKLPKPYKVSHYTDLQAQKWAVGGANINPMPEDHPGRAEYEMLIKWAEENELELRVVDDHDGMGMQSWKNITVSAY